MSELCRDTQGDEQTGYSLLLYILHIVDLMNYIARTVMGTPEPYHVKYCVCVCEEMSFKTCKRRGGSLHHRGHKVQTLHFTVCHSEPVIQRAENI